MGQRDAPPNSPRSALSPLALAPTEQQSACHFGPIDRFMVEVWDGSASDIGPKTNRSQNIHYFQTSTIINREERVVVVKDTRWTGLGAYLISK